MYAIVEIAGKQFKVKPGMVLNVPTLDIEPGKPVEVERVLAFSDGKDFKVGTPVLDDVQVDATVVEHGKDKKIVVFKKKRRKGYQRKRGHRQGFTTIQVADVKPGKAPKPKKAAEPKAAEAKKADAETKPATKTKAAAKPKSAAKKAAPRKTTAAKKPAAKKPAAKKPAAKKPAAEKTAKPAPKKDETGE